MDSKLIHVHCFLCRFIYASHNSSTGEVANGLRPLPEGHPLERTPGTARYGVRPAEGPRQGGREIAGGRAWAIFIILLIFSWLEPFPLDLYKTMLHLCFLFSAPEPDRNCQWYDHRCPAADRASLICGCFCRLCSLFIGRIRFWW